MLTILVPNPHRWWAVTAAGMPWLENPDLDHEDSDMPRWPDRDSINWLLIAEQSSSALGQFQPASRIIDEDGNAIVQADVELGTPEARIMKSWFRISEAPVADIWDDGVVNGRHRLWNGWKALPEATFPIYSHLLWSADDIPYMDQDFADALHESAETGLNSIPAHVYTGHPQTQEYLHHMRML